jgi:hypothetical protein
MKQPIDIKVNTNTPEFASWFAACQKGYADYMKAEFPNNPKEVLTADFGTRYIKISKVSEGKDETTGRPHSCSAWAFIDRTNGDVLKPATWKAPAKGARGNIFDQSNGLKTMGPYGPAYLRGPSYGTFAP